MLHAALDQHPAGAAQAETAAVQVAVRALVDRHAGLAGGLAHGGAGRNLDRDLLLDELNLGHETGSLAGAGTVPHSPPSGRSLAIVRTTAPAAIAPSSRS